MVATNSGFTEVLIGNPHLEAVKLLHPHISQINTLTDIVPWPPYFPPFHLMNREELYQPSLFLLQLLKIIPRCQKLVLQQDAYTLIFCGHTSGFFYCFGGGAQYLPK